MIRGKIVLEFNTDFTNINETLEMRIKTSPPKNIWDLFDFFDFHDINSLNQSFKDEIDSVSLDYYDDSPKIETDWDEFAEVLSINYDNTIIWGFKKYFKSELSYVENHKNFARWLNDWRKQK